jgi:hypothetical protein
MDPRVTAPRMASEAESAAVLDQVGAMLRNVSDSLDRMAAAGPLNSEQLTRLSVVQFTVSGLRKLFAEEAARTNGGAR